MKKILVLLVYLGGFTFFTYIIVHAISVARDLKRGELIRNVFIVKDYKEYKGWHASFKCRIIIRNAEKEVYTSSSSVIGPVGRFLVNHYVPAMYSKKYNELRLLLLPKDFKKYGLPYPDSLRWIDSLNRKY
ncbi:hypothetical protein [Niabella aurantiaca]|uniref:hypothetical protein n=1 Tax=Niabella aurantiaca TaxID=379900 RepID=UPI0003605F08|nr:hypothetical protein [Niabella aurantiaca]